MVLQRGQPIRIWGWSDIDSQLQIRFDQEEKTVMVDGEGRWSITFLPKLAGGPFTLNIAGTDILELTDIWIGDVWVASGQSNMQWPVRQTPYEEIDSSWLNQAPLRLLTVQIGSDYVRQDDIQGGEWVSLSEEHIADFSAVAYHFSRFLQKDLHIPIGIINSSLGATAVETWMSNESLAEFAQFRPEILPVIERNKSVAQLDADFAENKDAWEDKMYLTGPGIEGKWYRPETDISSWTDIQVPGFWEDQGLQNWDGAVWYRKQFDLPQGAEHQDSILLQLSQIDDYDITWVNGIKIGETYGRHNHRNYWIPSHLLKERDNVLVIRAFDIGGRGGFSTNAFWMSGMIRGTWKMRPGLQIDTTAFTTLPTVNLTPFSSPGVLFNANIAPLTQLPVTGIIWYQGESNADRAEEYRKLFPALIHDWRKEWKNSNLPFLFVQLANYKAESDRPEPSEWAELREAQTMALALPSTGMAVTIDIGEAGDIHPRNKVDVGLRLALAAENIVYHQDVPWHGPEIDRVEFVDGKALVYYASDGGTPVVTDKYGYIRGFALSGPDRVFHWAKAEMVGDHLEVFSRQVDTPVALRYAWSDNPGPLNLTNEQALPALPFRTDTWPGTTTGKEFNAKAPRF